MEDHYAFLNFSMDLKKDWYHSIYSSKPYFSNCMLLVQFSRSVMSDSVTPWTAAHWASLSITNSRNWVKLLSSSSSSISIGSLMPSNHLILCHPFLLPQSFPASGSFKWVSSSHQVAKDLEFQLQHQFFQWTHRTDLLWMDWLDLLAVQRTLKSLLQHHSSKASILLRSAFFIVQLLHPYMTTGKTIALTRWTFVDKVMSLLFNMLSRLVITSKE